MSSVFIFGYLSCVQFNFHPLVTFCQKAEKLRVQSEDETLSSHELVWPAIHLSVFPAEVVRLAKA